MATFRSTSVSSAGVAALCAIALACSAASGSEAVTIDGARVEGMLVGDGAAARFSGPSGELPLAQVVRVTYRAFRESAQFVSGAASRDGSVMRGPARVEKGGAVTVATARFATLRLQTSDIAEVRFDCREVFPPGGDRGVLLRNGDFVAANVVTLAPDAASVKSSLGDIELPYERVAAVRLAAIGRSGGEVSVALENGDMACGRLVSASDRWATVAGAFGEVRAPIDAVCAVEFPARMAYVSDLSLKVEKQELAPAGIDYHRLDAAWDGGVLAAGAASFRKGLVTRAGAVVTMEAPAGARKLCFTPGIARGSSPSKGRFSVLARGREAWSRTLDGAAASEAVTIDVSGAKTVSLVYASVPDGLIGSSGVWGDAFFTIGK